MNWIHKIIDEETTETLLDLYEEMKTSAPPVMAPDGTVIQRDGYDDILHSEELYDYFLTHVVGKEENYKRENGEPYVTLYEQWLDETYGHSAMWYFWDYVFSIDGLQTMLDIGGFFFDGCDLVNAAIYLLRGRGKEAFWSFVGAVPFIGSVIMAKKGTKLVSAAGNISTALKTEEAVTGLTLMYKVEDTGTKLASKTGDLSSIYKLEDKGTKLISTAGDLSTAMKTGDAVSDLTSMYKLEGKGTKLVSAAGDLPTAMKTGDAMSELSSMYKLEDTGTEFFKEVTPVVEEMCSTMNNSTSGLAVAGNMVCDNMGITVKTIDNAGDVAEILNTNKGGTRISNKFPNEAMPSDGKIIDYYIENGKIKGIEGLNKVDFVITTDNKLIIGNKHHYLGNGQDVLAAGQLKINGQGQIKRIDNLSGHYRPTVDEAMGYQSLFEGLELDLNKTWLIYDKFDIDADGMVVDTYTDYVKMLGGEN